MIPVAFTRWCWLALIALQFIWFGWLYPSEWFGRAIPLFLMALPLLIPAWWIWQLKPRALVLGGTILLLHFSVAVAEAWANPETRIIACVQIILVVVYFLAMPGLRKTHSQSTVSNQPTNPEQ